MFHPPKKNLLLGSGGRLKLQKNVGRWRFFRKMKHVCLEFPSTHLFSDLVDESWLFGLCLGLKPPERFSSTRWGEFQLHQKLWGCFRNPVFTTKIQSLKLTVRLWNSSSNHGFSRAMWASRSVVANQKFLAHKRSPTKKDLCTGIFTSHLPERSIKCR